MHEIRLCFRQILLFMMRLMNMHELQAGVIHDEADEYT